MEVVYGADLATCPVRAWGAWLAASGITNGPVFRPVDRHGRLGERRLSDQSVALDVKRHMVGLGQTSGTYAGHSLRRGMATTAAKGGASERAIMRTTGHASTQTVRGYIEEGELFTDPASGYLGQRQGSLITAVSQCVSHSTRTRLILAPCAKVDPMNVWTLLVAPVSAG